MASTPIEKVLHDIEQKNLAANYFLYGKEKYFHDQVIEALIAQTFDNPAEKDLNLNIFYGSENTVGQVISAALAYPMLSSRKLVIVRDFSKMKISDVESVEKYMRNPAKTTTLLISTEERSNAKIYKVLDKYSVSVDCKPIPDYKIGDWIPRLCARKGHQIEAEAAQLLLNHIGPDLLCLDQELQKIINYKNDDTAISSTDIEQTSGISRDESVFALQRVLARRDIEKSLTIGLRLLESGQDLIMLNAVLFAFFRKILIASSLRQRRLSNQQIGQEMHLSNFQMRDINEALKQFKSGQVKRIIEILNETDVLLKTTQISQQSLLKMLCFKICRM